MTNNALMPVEFAGATLYVINHEGNPFTPMKPIVEAIGMSWQGQHEKLKSNPCRWGIKEILIPSNGGEQYMSCLPLRKLAGWLSTVSSNKTKPELRERIIRYQNECDDVLWDYWNKATAQPLPQLESSLAPYSVHAGQTLSEDQAHTLRTLLDDFVKTLPKEKQGGFMVKGWAKLKAHFNVGYREIPADKFTDAVSIIARHIVEYSTPELPTPEPKQEGMDFSFLSLKNKRLLLSYDHNGRELIQRVPNEAMLVTWQEVAHILREHYLMVSLPQITEIINAGCDAIVKRMQGKMIAA